MRGVRKKFSWNLINDEYLTKINIKYIRSTLIKLVYLYCVAIKKITWLEMHKRKHYQRIVFIRAIIRLNTKLGKSGNLSLF